MGEVLKHPCLKIQEHRVHTVLQTGIPSIWVFPSSSGSPGSQVDSCNPHVKPLSIAYGPLLASILLASTVQMFGSWDT